MRLAVAIIVKDGASYLEKNLNIFRDICTKCASVVHFYVTENDSVDDTRTILQNMVDKGAVHKLDSITLDGKHSLSLCGDGEAYNCDARVIRLAMLRQRVLRNIFNSGLSYDYICVLDIDFVAIRAAELISVFDYLQSNPSVDGMFGVSVHASDLECIYDLSALGVSNTLRMYMPFSRYVRVTTAFGGVGVYRMSSIRQGASYTTDDLRIIDSMMGKQLHDLFESGHQESNEHAVFNMHFDHLLVDTQFRPVYIGTCNHPIRSNMTLWRKSFAIIFSILIAVIVWISARFLQPVSTSPPTK